MTTGGTSPHTSANPAQIAQEAATAFDWKCKGKTVREIAGLMNLSPSTVQRRITHEVEARVGPRVEEYRARQDQQIDNLETRLWAVVDDPTTELDDLLKVMDRLMKLMERRARLHGADAPVRVEGTVVHQTQEEAELEALFAARDAELANQTDQEAPRG